MVKQPLISIVDDDQPFRDSMRRLIASFGYAVAAFPSAAAFLSSAGLGATECLVADVHMPDMTGVELYEQLRQRGHTIPTILVTAYPDQRVEQRMRERGVEGFLQKPLEAALLIECLRAALARGSSCGMEDGGSA